MEMLSATLPLAMSAAVIAGGRLRERRRIESLNRALHELRRPLHRLALAPGDPATLGELRCALEDLDGAINGVPSRRRPVPVALRPLCEAAVRHAGEACPGAAPRPTLRWSAGEATVEGDPPKLSRVLENLLSNALEHGRPPLEVVGLVRSGRLRILIRDGGPRPPEGETRGVPAGRDPRRGHGLAIVREVAAEHGGRFVLRSSPAGTVAALDLPLAETRPPAA